jgi:hypothetical protein
MTAADVRQHLAFAILGIKKLPTGNLWGVFKLYRNQLLGN